MEVTELRVGNKASRNGIIVTVDARSIFDIWESSPEYSPIPLSKEWLLKLGLKKQHGFGCSNMWSKKTPQDLFFSVFEIPSGVRTGSKSTGVYTIQNGFEGFKYVHQLQNLYFALTGEELITENRQPAT